MTDECMAQLLALLYGKHLMCRGKREDWEQIKSLYEFGMEPLDDDTGRLVVRQLLRTAKWTPDVSEIIAAAARYESPTPSEDDAWSEVFAKCGQARPAPWTHPLVQHACKDLGGVDCIWHELQYANGGQGTPASVVSAQYRKAYVRRRQEWEAEVTEQLCLPKRQRKSALFPVAAGTRFHNFLPPDTQELRQIEARQENRIETPSIPLETIKARVATQRSDLQKAHRKEVIGRALADTRQRAAKEKPAPVPEQAGIE